MALGGLDHDGGHPFTVSRLICEVIKAWTNTGMAEKYGHVYATANRKRIATIMSRDHPEKQEITATVLKQVYNFGVAPGQATELRAIMATIEQLMVSPPEAATTPQDTTRPNSNKTHFFRRDGVLLRPVIPPPSATPANPEPDLKAVLPVSTRCKSDPGD